MSQDPINQSLFIAVLAIVIGLVLAGFFIWSGFQTVLAIFGAQ